MAAIKTQSHGIPQIVYVFALIHAWLSLFVLSVLGVL